MKNQIKHLLIALVLLSALNTQLSVALAQGTAFTYQGQLQNNGSLANGNYDLRLRLYDALTNGDLIAGPITNFATPVSNGLFTTVVDFGAGAFDGTNLWLQISVRTNGDANFNLLNPRQELTPVPYAVFAEGADAAGLSGTLPMASLNGTYGGAVSLTNAGNSFTGIGAGLANVNAATLGGLASSGFWQLGGNNVPNGSFIGTTNNQFLDFQVNNVRAMRLRLTTDAAGLFTNAPNIVMGSPVNLVNVSAVGGTVSGGGGNDMYGNSYPNHVTQDFGTVGGGLGNLASGPGAFIGGGGFDGNNIEGNTARGGGSVIGGGINNTASSDEATVGGGYDNIASGSLFGTATVGGGGANTASADYATISGGYDNVASGFASFIGGGGADGTTGGFMDDFLNSWPNTASGAASVIGGGLGNTNLTYAGTIAGGTFNTVTGTNCTVSGGYDNTASGPSYCASVVGGGAFNTANARYSTISGGYGNIASGFGSFIGGGGNDGANVYSNITSGGGSVIGGGVGNLASGGDSVVGGGAENATSNFVATVSGGLGNLASGPGAFIGGGGFDGNNIEGNTASGAASVISGGFGNLASGIYSTVPGGQYNSALGTNSFAAGNNATANFAGSFVWSDDTGTSTHDTGHNQFVVRASSGFFFYTDTGGDGVHLNPGATAWTTLSDRNAKKNFKPVDYVAVLDKLATVPIEQWNYKWEKDSDVPNIGPMAQDFKHAFYPGRDDKGISTLEFDGVELAAIQGLNQKLEVETKEKDAEIQTLKSQNDSLAERLNELEATVKALAEKKRGL
jgi:hypothetical protein